MEKNEAAMIKAKHRVIISKNKNECIQEEQCVKSDSGWILLFTSTIKKRIALMKKEHHFPSASNYYRKIKLQSYLDTTRFREHILFCCIKASLFQGFRQQSYL